MIHTLMKSGAGATVVTNGVNWPPPRCGSLLVLILADGRLGRSKMQVIHSLKPVQHWTMDLESLSCSTANSECCGREIPSVIADHARICSRQPRKGRIYVVRQEYVQSAFRKGDGSPKALWDGFEIL